MHDPAIDINDHRQDAEVAVLERRLGPNGVSTAISNSKRSAHRKAITRRDHSMRVDRHLSEIRRRPPDPAEQAAAHELAKYAAREIYGTDPRLLCILLLREQGHSRQTIAAITGLKPGTVSRAPRRAAKICKHYAPE